MRSQITVEALKNFSAFGGTQQKKKLVSIPGMYWAFYELAKYLRHGKDITWPGRPTDTAGSAKDEMRGLSFFRTPLTLFMKLLALYTKTSLVSSVRAWCF